MSDGELHMASTGAATPPRTGVVTGRLGADFESATYSGINERRWSFFAPLIDTLKEGRSIVRVLDVGAGAGFFSGKLVEAGFQVTAVDGREENIAAIRARHAAVSASVVDVQSPGSLSGYADFDLLFCAGLLYHLDNPVAGIRALAEHPAPIALIETQLLPGDEPLFRFVEEGVSVTQGLSHIALVPTRAVLVRLLAMYGRPFIYETTGLPDHEQFRGNNRYHQLRRVFVAAKSPVEMPRLRRVHATSMPKGFHAKRRSLVRRVFDRLTGR